MDNGLSGKRIAFLATTEGTEQVELTKPGRLSNGPAAQPNWRDKEVVVYSDGPDNLICSRQPDGPPAFCAALVQTFGTPSPGSD